MLRRSEPRYLIKPLPLWALFVALGVALVMPCATPFATASMASSDSRKPTKADALYISTQPSTTTSSSLYKTQHLARFKATADAANEVRSNNRRFSLSRFMGLLKGKEQEGGNNWRGGEAAASLPSRLFFKYASPLLDQASQRRLEVDDAFYIAEDRQMGTAVPALATIYESMRTKSKRKIEQCRQQGSKKVKASQSILLTKALLLHQKRMLLWTGFLRLCNTSIQAFPAVSLARLLRLVEAGDTQPPSKALIAAVQLISVLLVKMIIENQYFHYVVKCSTEVRGALSGIIFDKSLRLPGGGNAVTHKTDKKKGEKATALGAGGVLNLMQSDASIIESAAMQIHTIWDAPLQVRIGSRRRGHGEKVARKSDLWIVTV